MGLHDDLHWSDEERDDGDAWCADQNQTIGPLTIIGLTPKGVHVRFAVWEGRKDVQTWLPRSQVYEFATTSDAHAELAVGVTGSFRVPGWLARRI